jgi:amino acid permease
MAIYDDIRIYCYGLGWKEETRMSKHKVTFIVILVYICLKDLFSDDSYLELLAFLFVAMFVLLVWSVVSEGDDEPR